MRDSLVPGIRHEHTFVVPETKTVPALYPESAEFGDMPEVFATGFLVGLLEWTCVLALMPHLDWPQEQSVGVHVDISHEAATPAGLEVTARAELVKVNGRRLLFEVQAHDGIDVISRGRHERCVVDRARFESGVAGKKAGGAASTG